MCRDISFHSEIQVITEVFPGIKIPNIKQTSNDIWAHVSCESIPSYPVVVALGDLQLAEMEWGVIPTYEKDPQNRQLRRRNMVNARSERVLEDKKSYWYRLRRNRCLIPATGIYEHRKVAGFKNKVPYLVSQEGRNGFFVPGLYQVSQEVDRETGELFETGSFAMLTCSANELMQWIHNDGENKHRMPLFLPAELEKAWLSPDLTERDMEEIFAFRIPSEALSHHPVFSIRSRSQRPDGKPKDEYYDYGEDLPQFGKDEGTAGVQTRLF